MVDADAFNASYYSTVAQVIPVFLLFALATRFFKEKAAATLPVQLNLLLVVMVLSGIWAEASALTALRDQKGPSDLEEMVIIWAIVIPMLFIVVESVLEPASSIIEAIPESLRPFFEWGGKALVVGLIPAYVLGWNVAAIVAGLLVAMLAVAFVLPSLTDVTIAYRSRKQASDDEPT
jgi:hypothetical protein